MATPNYGYEKRQRELAKKQKKEEKLRAKADKRPHEGEPDPGEAYETPNAGSTVGDPSPKAD